MTQEHVPEAARGALVTATPAERKARWLDDRRNAITATDAGQLYGVSPYGGPIDVFLAKLGQLPDLEPTEEMEAGNWFQPAILDWYAHREQKPIIHADPFEFHRSQRQPIVGASLDAIRAVDGIPVDAKNIGRMSAEWGESGTDVMPLHYAVQLVVQMYVTNTPCAELVALFHGQNLRVYTLWRDAELENSVVERCLSFWHNHVAKRIPPPIDGTPAYTAYLKRKFARHSEVTVEALPAINEAAVMLSMLRDQIDGLEIQKAECENIIKSAIGEAKAIEGSQWRATWSKSKDAEKIDFKQLSNSFALMLMEKGVAQEEIGRIRQIHTQVQEGHRTFRFTYKGD
jgi:putative phage-type endonuclease